MKICSGTNFAWVAPQHQKFSALSSSMLSLIFVVRGIQEQYDVAVSKFKCVPQDRSVYDESVYYECSEFISKSNHRHQFYH